VTRFTILVRVFASTAIAAPPPPKVDTPGTFLLQEHVERDKDKNGTVLLDEKGRVIKYLHPYALAGARSPDGRRLACIEVDEEADPNATSYFRMVLRPLLGKQDPVFLPLNVRQNTDFSSVSFFWSISGLRVLVQESGNDMRRGHVEFLRRYDLDTKSFMDLKFPAKYRVTGWSADEAKLLATSSDNRLCWLNADGTGKPDFITPDTEVCRDAKLSSDDTRVLFLCGPTPPRGERWFLRLTAMELSTKKRVVLDDPGETLGHCWSKDNSRVAFTWQKTVSNKTPATEYETILYTCDRDGKNRTAVTSRKKKWEKPTAGPVKYFEVHDWK
jgi:hypothetical protein